MGGALLMPRVEFNAASRTATVMAGDLISLASAVVHAEEFLSPTGNPVDKDAFESNVRAAQPLLDELGALAMLPVKR